MSQVEDDDHNHKEDDLHHHDTVMPGFRFHPTEEELIEFYLRRKIEGKRFNVDLITFLDLYRYDPWELPALASIGEKEWYFYVPRDKKYRNGDRPNRVTTSGYWKATGADRLIKNDNLRPIGLKKTLVFYSGKAPRGVRTSWIMNEYRLPHHETEMLQKAEISLCRVYKRPGVEDRPTVTRANLGKAASNSSRVAFDHNNFDSKPTQQDVVMNSSCGQQQEEAEKMSAETSASSSTEVGSAKHEININQFLQIASMQPLSLVDDRSSFFSILGNNPVILPNHENNNIQFEDLQRNYMTNYGQQGYYNNYNQQQQQLGMNMNIVPNTSFWDQWTSSSSILHGDDINQGSSKGYNNVTNPFR